MKDYQEEIIKLLEVRNCYNCYREIRESMGGVLVRDLLGFMETGERLTLIRELCGICAIKVNPEDIK